MAENKGKLFVISGPSGSGKGELCKRVLKTGCARVSISATTRSARPGEVDGVNYFFITKEEFERRIKVNDFLEFAQYNGNYYGTPKDYVISCLERGINIILEIDVQGALNIKKIMPDAVLLMISAPDYSTLVSRLRGRGDTSEDDMKERLETSRVELAQLPKYDFLVINKTNELDRAVETVCQIIGGKEMEENKTKHFESFANDFYLI